MQVVKENQILQKGDRTIDVDNEYATLVDANIFAGDQIIVRDSEIHENRDIAGMLFYTSTRLTFPYVYRNCHISILQMSFVKRYSSDSISRC